MTYFLYINFVQLVLLSISISVIFFGGLVNFFEKRLPPVIVQAVRYGKFADNKTKSPFIVQVPKSWFRHFYIYSSIITSAAFYLCINNYVWGKSPPEWVYIVLDYSLGTVRKPTVNSTRVLLTISLLTLQCLRRLYDTNFVSIFSKNAKIHIGHYTIGFFHYTACVITILGEAPNFSKVDDAKAGLNWSDLNIKDLYAVFVFLWAWYHQYKSAVILANLRKDDNGNVISQGYKLPKGGWFDAISSPHIFAEILMYSSLTLILWPNFTWWFIYIWVVSNQVEVAILAHRWYHEKFEDVPKNWKMLIPYVY